MSPVDNWGVPNASTILGACVPFPEPGGPKRMMMVLAPGSTGGAAGASAPSATVVTFAPSSVSSFVDSAMVLCGLPRGLRCTLGRAIIGGAAGSISEQRGGGSRVWVRFPRFCTSNGRSSSPRSDRRAHATRVGHQPRVRHPDDDGRPPTPAAARNGDARGPASRPGMS